MNLFLQLLNPANQCFPIFPEFFTIHPDPRLLHVIQGKYQRHLDLIEQLSHPHLVQFFQKLRHLFKSSECRIRFIQIFMLIAAHERIDKISRNLNIKQMLPVSRMKQ